MKILFNRRLFVALTLISLGLFLFFHSRTATEDIPILCYHAIESDDHKKDSLTLPKKTFKSHLETIENLGYKTLSLDEFNSYIQNNIPFPDKTLLITFDDGYKSTYDNAIPILQEYNMKATFFVVPSYCKRPFYMSNKEIKNISDLGFDIQSHTENHKELGKLSYKEQLKELKDSKENLENIVDTPITAIAYPVGSYNDNTIKATKDSGYSLGFTINSGFVHHNNNKYELNRICIDYTFNSFDIAMALE